MSGFNYIIFVVIQKDGLNCMIYGYTKDKSMEKVIFVNMIDTYPDGALRAETADEFYDLLREEASGIICQHITRLTEQEIQSIKEHGLQLGSKEMLKSKINNLPDSCNWFKKEMIDHIEQQPIRANNASCMSYGRIDWESDSACNKVFANNWGGENIYNYYDDGSICPDLRNKRIIEELKNISFPCVVLIKVSVNSFIKSQLGCLFEKIKERGIENVTGAIYLENEKPEVIDVIRLDERTIEY